MPISLIADELWHYDRSAPIHVKTVSMTAALTRLHQNQLTAGPFAVSRAGRPSRASKSPIRTVIHLRITAPPQRWPTPRGKAIAIVRSGGGESQAAITGMGLLELAEILNRMTCNAASRPPKSAPLTSAMGRCRPEENFATLLPESSNPSPKANLLRRQPGIKNALQRLNSMQGWAG